MDATCGILAFVLADIIVQKTITRYYFKKKKNYNKRYVQNKLYCKTKKIGVWLSIIVHWDINLNQPKLVWVNKIDTPFLNAAVNQLSTSSSIHGTIGTLYYIMALLQKKKKNGNLS